jgi:arylsulfatase A-like enzyme
MEVFAGMLTNLDDNVGKRDRVSEIKSASTTTLSSCSPETTVPTAWATASSPTSTAAGNLDIDNSLENYGKPGSFIFRSTRWAEAGTAPFRLFKGFTAEGGLSVPTIVRLPKQNAGAAPSTALSTLRDIVPTILDLAGVCHCPARAYQGRSIATIEGRSLLPALHGSAVFMPTTK